MFSWLTNAWRVPELRHRVLFTAMILGFYRLGGWVPGPGVNSVALAALQAAGYSYLFNRQIPDFQLNAGRFVLIVVSLTAATTLLMWMGELITKRGVGNGISLLIFASILAGLPGGIRAWYEGEAFERVMFPAIALAIIIAVVFVQEGQRRIPIQYAKRMVGRRMTSGGSTYMPLRVNMAGGLPNIFPAGLLALP